METSADLQLTVDGMPIFGHESCDAAAFGAAQMLLEEGGGTVRTCLLTGSHGSGKTTLLKLIDVHARSMGAGVGWFNSWKHKEDVDPFCSMLFSLWDELDITGTPRVVENETISAALRAAAFSQNNYPDSAQVYSGAKVTDPMLALLAAVEISSQLVVGNAPVNELAQAAQWMANAGAYQEGLYRHQKLLERARSYMFPTRFKALLSTIVDHLRMRQVNPHMPMLLFVDGLDRCPPALGLALLEAIGRYYHVPGLAVVVAVDENVARAWAASVYQGNVEAKTYIDKLFDRRILGVEERARMIWAQILGVEWRMSEWSGLVGRARPEMADRAVISATRLLRIHSGSDIRRVRRALAEVRTIIVDNADAVSKVTLVPDIVRLGVLCGFLVRERFPRVVERLSDLRLHEARLEVLVELMQISQIKSEDEEEEDPAAAWLREFLQLTPFEEREMLQIIDIRHFLATEVLMKVGSMLLLLGMGLK